MLIGSANANVKEETECRSVPGNKPYNAHKVARGTSRPGDMYRWNETQWLTGKEPPCQFSSEGRKDNAWNETRTMCVAERSELSAA